MSQAPRAGGEGRAVPREWTRERGPSTRRRATRAGRAADAARARRTEEAPRRSSSASRPAPPPRAGARATRRRGRARQPSPAPRWAPPDRRSRWPLSPAECPPPAQAARGNRTGRRRAGLERASPDLTVTVPAGPQGLSSRSHASASRFMYKLPRVAATAAMAKNRSALYRALRDHLESRGYLEVETPIAVPFAGQEPHLRPFETVFRPDPPVRAGGVSGARRLQLHTSPEYAMKRLLAREGFGRIYQLARVFRDGEVSRTHNPEFTLLELYASPGSAQSIMADVEQILFEAAPEVPARK